MKKNWLIVLIICLILCSQGVRAEHSLIDIFLKGEYTNKIDKNTLIVDFKIHKISTDAYERIKEDYDDLKNKFNKKYDRDRKLVSESSTVNQAFINSRKLLDTCINFTDKFNDLKSSVLMELLVGEWEGKAVLNISSKINDEEWSLKRILNVKFYADYAGIISRGVVEGNDVLTFKSDELLEKPKNKDEKAEVTGLVSGMVVPKEESILTLNIDSPLTFKEINKSNEIELTGKTDVIITPFITREIIDEAYSLTVSHMKIYYNLLFKSRRPAYISIKNKYSLFFEDILYLLEVQSKDYISEEVYKNLSIYKKSEYVNEAFEDYFFTMTNYYASSLSKLRPGKHKIMLLRQYLEEIMYANAICNSGIVDKKLITKLNISINKPNSLFDQLFSRYYEVGKDYFQKELEEVGLKRKKETLKKEYKEFLTEIIELAKSGLFSSEILQSYSISEKLIEKANDF